MMLLKFTRSNLKLLIEISKKGTITTRSQKTFSPFAFYLNKSELEENGLITCNGIDNHRRKEWKLTEKGKIVVSHLKKIEEALTS